MSWTQTPDNQLLFKKASKHHTGTKVAAFDIDWCVIKTRSGRLHPKDGNDWELWRSPEVREKLQWLNKNQYQLLFITNQAGLLKKNKVKEWTQKMDQVLECLGLEDGVTVLASLQKRGEFRKPCIGMWKFFVQNVTAKPPVLGDSFFVGDAAGRPKRGSLKKDFSASDLKFASNVGLPFYVPEQFFLGSKHPRDCDRALANLGFDPKVYWKNTYTQYMSVEKDAPPSAQKSVLDALSTREEQTLVVVVGSPASGKSTLSLSLIRAQPTWFRVNQDTLKTLARCVKAAEKALEGGQNVIVDNTNRDTKTRQHYVRMASERKIPCVCVWLQTTKEEVFHLNAYRGCFGAPGETGKRQVPDVVLHTYHKRLEPPEPSEGFSEILVQPFFPGPFETKQQFHQFFRFYH